MSGLDLNLEDILIGLAILTCYHMEEGKVPSSMAGSQDALLPILIGILVAQTIPVTIKIMQHRILAISGMTGILKNKCTAVVSTTQL